MTLESVLAEVLETHEFVLRVENVGCSCEHEALDGLGDAKAYNIHLASVLAETLRPVVEAATSMLDWHERGDQDADIATHQRWFADFTKARAALDAIGEG